MIAIGIHLTHERVWYAVRARIAGPAFFNDWFQQDSATVHIACMSMQALSDVFGDRYISSGILPAYLPDLYHCDLFFCSSLKDKVYNSKLH
jgi:hypothetical protein